MINLRREFRVRKIVRVLKIVRTKLFAGFAIFSFFHISKIHNSLVFVLVNGIIFNKIKIACLMN